jgi:short-subunit dehydrogenase
MAGEIVYPNGAVYCGTKAAARAINDGLRDDLLGTPVRVTSVDPGMVETDFGLVRFHGAARRAAKVFKRIKPLTAEDIAEVILWAVTRPEHVNIARVSLTSIHQANSLLIHREDAGLASQRVGGASGNWAVNRRKRTQENTTAVRPRNGGTTADTQAHGL